MDHVSETTPAAPTLAADTAPPEQSVWHRFVSNAMNQYECDKLGPKSPAGPRAVADTPLAGQALFPETGELLRRLGLPADGKLTKDEIERGEKCAAFTPGQQTFINALNDNSDGLTALSRGYHVPTGNGQMTWMNAIGFDGITQADIAKFDQYQTQYDTVVKNNPAVAKANAMFEFAAKHLSELAGPDGQITEARLQAFAQSGDKTDADLKQIKSLQDEMPAVAHHLALPGWALGETGVSLLMLQHNAAEAYEDATGTGMTGKYQADLVLDMRRDLMRPEEEIHDPIISLPLR